MKRLAALSLILITLLLIGGCGKKSQETTTPTTTPTTPTTTPSETEETTETETSEPMETETEKDPGYDISTGERASTPFDDVMGNVRCFEGNKFEFDVQNTLEEDFVFGDTSRQVTFFINGFPHRDLDCGDVTSIAPGESATCTVVSRVGIKSQNKVALTLGEERGTDYMVSCS